MAPIITPKSLRLAIAACNFTTWLSSAIIVGITGYFLAHYPHDQHLIFEMCIVRLSPRSQSPPPPPPS